MLQRFRCACPAVVKNPPAVIISAFCICLLAGSATAQSLVRPPDISFRHEVEHAIDEGMRWLEANQNSNGWWSASDDTAATALALTALAGEPTSRPRAAAAAAIARGFKFVAGQAGPDGGFSGKGPMPVNTSLCVIALMAVPGPGNGPMLDKARGWLTTHHVDSSSDLYSIAMALEALSFGTNSGGSGGKPVPNAAAAIHFIESCWNTNSPDKGGFVGEPGGATVTGSATCAGLLGYIDAGVKLDDPRVVAAFDWVCDHFSLNENPGAAQQGFHRYLYLMTRALTLWGTDQLRVNGGQTIDWRREMAMKLINLQNSDGSWTNPKGRQMDDNPAATTAYSVICLEILWGGL